MRLNKKIMKKICNVAEITDYLKDNDTNCIICYEKTYNHVAYLTECCKKLACKSCIEKWHETKSRCIVCRKPETSLNNYIVFYQGEDETGIEHILQENEQFLMEFEESQMKTILDLELGKLIKCEYCGNIWDGNAQCNCYQMNDYYDYYDDTYA